PCRIGFSGRRDLRPMHAGRLRRKGLGAPERPRHEGAHHSKRPRDGDGAPHDPRPCPGISRRRGEVCLMERQASMRILYVGWVGYGNLGDDLCRDLFIHHVREALGPRGIKAEIRTASHRGISKEALLEFHPHLVVLGAGSLMTLHYLQPIILAQAHGIPTITWGTGFDKLSKQHLYELLMGARRLSFWQDQGLADTFRRAVDGCRWAGVRGPHTLRLLQAAGCASPTLHVSGDPGLCLEPPSTPEELPPGLSDSSEWAGALEWLSAHDAVVGVNWGTANNHVFGGEELGVQRGLEAVMTRLLRRSYKILLFAVWGPDLSPLRRLAARFQS